MKTYLELIETLSNTEMRTRVPLFVRVEVVDKADAISRLGNFESYFQGRNYTKRVHYCKHEEGLPCEIENL